MKKTILLLSCMFIVRFGYTQNHVINGDGVVVTAAVSNSSGEEATIPQFPGGSRALTKFINSTVRYPAAAKEANIEGKVIVRFIVDADGSVKSPYVQEENKLGFGCDEEAVRVISLSPKWEPVISNGSPVSVWHEVPVSFVLSQAR